MRQIDNMTPQEIDTLALKGMTAGKASAPETRTATEEMQIEAARAIGQMRQRRREREQKDVEYRFDDCTTKYSDKQTGKLSAIKRKRTIPAEKPCDVPDDGPDGFEREDGSETQHGSVEAERNQAQALADKLAEALRAFAYAYNKGEVHSDQEMFTVGKWSVYGRDIKNAHAALAAYEAAQ
jgi:hypothetical protein